MPPKQIMIVEDEGLIANAIAGHLRQFGHEVAAIASSGEEAMKILEHSKPDLILMDIRLKGETDGVDTAVRVRSEYGIPVIFLTSHADRETMARARFAEPFGYLAKPFRPVNLSTAIEIALHKHQGERALLDREAWLTTVLHLTADPTIVTDAEGVVQFLNPSAEQLLGWTVKEGAGRPWKDILPLLGPGGEAAGGEVFSQALLHGGALRLPEPLMVVRRSGERLAVEGEVAASLQRKQIAGAVITMRDVSQRNAREALVRERHKAQAIERLAGGVAHDFNNLMTVIIAHGETLAAGMCEAAEIERIQAVLEAARTAGGIAGQLLSLGGKLVLAAELVELNERVRRMVGMMGTSLGACVQIRTVLGAGLLRVRINPAQLDQILLNLLVNARDAMPQGGTILITTMRMPGVPAKVEADRPGDWVCLRVTDEGPGIPPEAQEHLFEPFFTTKRHGQGSGLGLAIVSGIVKDAGGEISVHSRPGDGATFEISFPVANELADAGQSLSGKGRAAAAPEGSADQKRTILLAEDQPAIQFLITSFLKEKGFHVMAAGNGQEALELALAYPGPIHLLLSDVLMPLMDGPMLARQLSERRPGTRIVMMSGDPGAWVGSMRDMGLDADFLQKPFGLPRLLEKVEEMTGYPQSGLSSMPC
jgi:PAS domain S-box-containing protein